MAKPLETRSKTINLTGHGEIMPAPGTLGGVGQFDYLYDSEGITLSTGGGTKFTWDSVPQRIAKALPLELQNKITQARLVKLS